MDRKKVFLLVVFLMLIMGLFPNAVSAANGDGGVGEGLGSAFETIRKMFEFLPELVTLENLIGEEPAAIFWAKFLVWLFLFAIVYFGGSAIPGLKESKNILVVIALVISLMGALLMPTSMLINLFQTYGIIAGLILFGIPLAAAFWLSSKIEWHLLKAMIYAFAIFILINIEATFFKEAKFLNTSFPYFTVILAVVTILFFYHLFASFGGISGAGAAGGAFNWLRNAGPLRGPELRDPEARRQRGQATEQERQAQENLDSIQNAKQKLTEVDAALQRHLQEPDKDIHQHFANIAELLLRLEQVQQALDKAENEVRGRM